MSLPSVSLAFYHGLTPHADVLIGERRYLLLLLLVVGELLLILLPVLPLGGRHRAGGERVVSALAGGEVVALNGGFGCTEAVVTERSSTFVVE